MDQHKILLIDDEQDYLKITKTILEDELFLVFSANNPDEAWAKIGKAKPDLIILDITMPGMDGYQFCRKLKGDPGTANLPVIFLSNKSAEFDKVLGLELGAEDYITKSTGEREFIARIKTVLRRRSISATADAVLTSAKLTINLDTREVNLENKKIILTPKEFDLLALFVKKKGRVLQRNFLFESICGYENFGSSRAIDTHIKQLRKKLGSYGQKIKTFKGIGYVFEI
ncbi:MAG: response regulator transcription factor [Elusimicrobiota bacterium]